MLKTKESSLCLDPNAAQNTTKKVQEALKTFLTAIQSLCERLHKKIIMPPTRAKNAVQGSMEPHSQHSKTGQILSKNRAKTPSTKLHIWPEC